jgi:predicted chitinase
MMTLGKVALALGALVAVGGPPAAVAVRRRARRQAMADLLVTPEQLEAVAPRITADEAEAYAPALSAAMWEARILTPRQRAAFIAQLAMESDSFKALEEYASGAAYEGRKDLGNTQSGDGVRYKGRGFIQLTGRYNYRKAGQALGVDFEGRPELAAVPANAARVAGWYWTDRKINEPAEAGDFPETTRRINGAYLGQVTRETYYARALKAFGGTP